MAAILREAGPEWAYCAPLAAKDSLKIDFDNLLINIQRQGDQPATIIDSLQVLSNEQEVDNFELFFEAYEGALPGVAIPDGRSFRRLLIAISNLGLPTPASPNQLFPYPPVLRFIARPKVDPEPGIMIDEPAPELQPPRGRPITTPVEDNEPLPGFRSQSGRRTKAREEIIEPEHSEPHLGHRSQSRPRIKAPVEDIRIGHEGTPTSDIARPAQSSSLAVPTQPGANEFVEKSFLASPSGPPRELTFEQRIEEDLSYGLSDSRDDVHDPKVNDLYADIAGISRNKRNPENPDHEYQPPYSTISLPPHQRYPTGWLLSDSARILHYLADKPGLGKTFAAVEAMVRITMILSNGLAIEQERAQLSSLRDRPLHIHDTDHPRFGRNEKCQANTVSKYGIVCQCDKKSPTYRKFTRNGYFAEGYMLVVAPLHLNAQWAREFKRFIRSTVRLPHNQKPFEIVIVHDTANHGNFGEAMKSFIHGEREHYGLGTICIAPATTTMTSTLKSLRDEPKKTLKQQPSIIVWDEVHATKRTDNQPVQLVRSLIDRAVYPVHVLALSGSPWTDGPSDFDVIQYLSLLPDSKSFPGWFEQEVYDDYTSRLQKARTNLNNSSKQVAQSDIIGRGKKGDFQNEGKPEAHDVLLSHDQRLREYAVEVPLLQRKERSRYLGYYIPRNQPDSEKAEIIRCDSKMNNVQKSVANGYKEYLRVRYRHRVKYWSLRPEATRGPRPKVKEVLFALEARTPVPDSSRITVSLIGFAPGLASRVLKRSRSDSNEFRAPEANAVFRGTTTNSQRQAIRNTPFWSMARYAFETMDEETGEKGFHPKIQFICSKIDEMLQDKEEHANGPQKRFGVLPKKMIICTAHAWQAVQQKLIFTNVLGGCKT